MSFPIYRQLDSMDCGPTCLRMVAKFYGRTISLQSLRDATQIGKEGVSLLGISDAAENLGFRTRAVKISFSSLVNEALLPCILFWDQAHFLVLPPSRWRRRQIKSITVADPALGLLTYTREEFLQHWLTEGDGGDKQGIALLLEPSPDFYSNAGDSPAQHQEGLAFRKIFNYLSPYKALIGQLFIGLLLGSMLQMALPFLTQSVVDVGVNTANLHFVFIILLAQLALLAGRLMVDFVRSWILLHISSRINVSILTDFLIKLMKLPVSFFDSRKTGDILQRINDHHRIESFLTCPALSILFSLLNLLVFSVVMAFFNLYIFTVFLVSTVLYAAWMIVFLKKKKRLNYRQFDVAAQQQSATIQMVVGMQEIKLHGIERPIRWKWEHLQAKSFRLGMNSLLIDQVQQTGGFLLNEGKNIFITFLSAKAVITGQMTIGTMLAVQYVIGQLNSPIEQMINFVQSWQNAKISMDRLNEIHRLE